MRFDVDELRAALKTVPCPSCWHAGGLATIELEGPHFARITCSSCGYFVDWLGWPPQPEKRERRRTARRAQAVISTDHCEICLRTRIDLPPSERLAIHHVDEDPTNDEPENHRVYCTGCHQLVHWARTYFGHIADRAAVA